MGQDSIATARNGVATGNGAVATGGDLSRDELNAKKQQYDSTLAEINNQNQTIATKDQEIAAKNTEIELAEAVAPAPNEEQAIIVIEQPAETPKAAEAAIPAVESKSPAPTAEMLEQEKKMAEIVKISQDTELMAKYQRRTAPIYNIENKEATALENIRSTKLSTFLVFQENTDVSQYKVEGAFQDMAKVSNIIGLQHRQKPAPQQIKITTPEGKITLLHKTN